MNYRQGIYRCGIILSLLILTVSQLTAQEWELVTDKEGIQVYTSLKSESGFKTVKVNTTFPVSVDHFLSVLDDVPSYTNWAYKCIKSKKIKEESAEEYWYRLEIEMPTLFTNRDIILHTKKWKDENSGYYYSEAKSDPDFLEDDPKKVRIQTYHAFWKIIPIGKSQTKIEYIVEGTPGGKVPSWVANLFIVTGPYKSIKKLNDYLVETESKLLTYKK